MSRSVGFAVPTLGLAVIFALGCGLGGDSSEDVISPPGVDEADAVEQVLVVDLASKPSFGALQSTVLPIARDGEVHNRIDVRFNQPLVPGARVGKPVDAATVAAVSPAVDGAWTWSAGDTMRFEPAAGTFAPNQAYTVTLSQVESPWGPIEAGETPLVTQFKTAAFSWLKAEPGAVTATHVDIDLVFSAPVASSDASKVTLKRGGKAVPATPVASGAPNRLRLRVPSAHVDAKRATAFDIAIAPGVSPLVGSGALSANTRKLTVDTTVKPMKILASKVKEGREGYFFEFVCHDEASGKAQYWWDRETYESYRVSPRCALDLSAADKVSITPPIAGQYLAESNHGFRIMGDVQPGTYTVSIAAGAVTVDGGLLDERFSREFTVKKRTARAELVSNQGRYLPRGGWDRVGVSHLNVDEVRVQVRHVPESNLVYWMSGASERADARTSKLVVDTKIPVRGTDNVVATTFIDIGKLVGAESAGLFEIGVSPVLPGEAADEDEDEVDTGFAARRRRAGTAKAATSYARVLLTDVQLVAKASAVAPGQPWGRFIDVWALNTHDLQPRVGTLVEAVRASGEALASCRVNAKGACRITMPEPGVDDAPAVALVAKLGKDTSYLAFADVAIPLSEAQVAGEPYLEDRAYRASLYLDRGVYRPGDTVHFATVVRDEAHVAPQADLPVQLVVTDPRGKEVKVLSSLLNGAGMAAFDLTLGSYAATGAYRGALKIGGRTVGQVSLSVEEFVPERMAVKAKLTSASYSSRDDLRVDIEAQYLFGGSAAGSSVNVTCTIEPSVFDGGQSAQFTYGPASVGEEPPRPVALGTASGELDDDGKATISCPPLKDHAGFLGTGRLVADVQVFEAGGGRATRAMAYGAVHPGLFYVGLASGVEKVVAGQSFTVKGRVVDWEGRASAAVPEVQVELFRLDEEWGWWWYSDDGHSSAWERNLRKVPEGRVTVPVGKDGSFEVKHAARSNSAGFLVRVVGDHVRTDLVLKGAQNRYSWSSGDQVDQTPRPLKPTLTKVAVPERIRVGATAEARIDVPFSGRLLTTIETHEVVKSEWHDVQAGTFTWPFSISEYADDIYVSALVVKDPHLESKDAYAPERAFGVSRVRVQPEAFQHSVKLGVPGEARSNTTLNIEVAVDAPSKAGTAWVTVAAVDEGILSLTKFTSPDPTDELFPRRRLGVRSFETVGWTMMMQAGGTTSASGGDGEGDAGRVQPVKPVALWSGLVQVPSNGKLTIPLEIPQYRGKLRVMAVSATANTVASAEASVLVRDPLTLQTTLPRFLAQGDTFDVPVFVTNLSGQSRDVTIALSVDNLPWPGMEADPNAPAPVTFLGDKQTKVTIAKDASQTVVFQARAVAGVGAARFTVKASAGNLISYDELDVPFAPIGVVERRVQQIELVQGKLDLAPLLDGWTPTTERTQVWVTPNPYANGLANLSHLIRYPHGCIEQTTSATRPLLYVSALLPALPPEVDAAKIDDMVQSGVDRVLSMQSSGGGFSYWPGSDGGHAWVSAYATHLLIDAKAKGYKVPDSRLADALTYLEREAQAERNAGDQGYLHFVLARGGKPLKAKVQALLAASDAKLIGRDQEDRYLLMAALYLAGDRRYEKELRAVDTAPVTSERINDWSFYSDFRRRGMVLAAYQDVFGDGDAGATQLARLVGERLAARDGRYYSTQELVWGVTGLARMVDSSAKMPNGVTLSDSKRTKLTADDKGKGKRIDVKWDVPRGSERGLVLDVPKLDGKLYAVLTSEGLRPDGVVRLGGEGLEVSREWVDADGRQISPNDITLGDVVYTRITVKNTTRETQRNLALVDRLPAGWEIENARLGRSGNIDHLYNSSAWEPDHLDLRDDRLALFGELRGNETRSVVYAVRAVTSGTFYAPPVEIEAMYNPDIWARAPGGKVSVIGPWDGKRL